MSDMRPLSPRWDQMTEAELRRALMIARNITTWWAVGPDIRLRGIERVQAIHAELERRGIAI